MELPCETCLNVGSVTPIRIMTPMNMKQTSLMRAAYHGHKECLEKIISSSKIPESNPNINKDLFAGLFNAVKEGNLDCTELLLREGAVMEIYGNLCEKDSKNHQQCVKLLLQERFNSTEEWCHTMVPEAAFVNHVECIKILLKAGCNINQEDYEGWTALASAACTGDIECLNVLLQAGADVNCLPSESSSFPALALCNAIRYRKFMCIKPLLEAGADVNLMAKGDGQEGCEYQLPLQLAITRCLDVSQLLIKSGADVNRTSATGKTALMDAALSHVPKGIELLLKEGALVNVADEFGYTPLIYATVHNLFGLLNWHTELSIPMIQCVKLILKAGATINNKVEKSSLNAIQNHIGCVQKYAIKEVCMMLLAAGEAVEGTHVKYSDLCQQQVVTVDVPKYLLPDDANLCLKHMCREKIRKHLINIDNHIQLFIRVPKLGLPLALIRYLLYDVSLD